MVAIYPRSDIVTSVGSTLVLLVRFAAVPMLLCCASAALVADEPQAVRDAIVHASIAAKAGYMDEALFILQNAQARIDSIPSDSGVWADLSTGVHIVRECRKVPKDERDAALRLLQEAARQHHLQLDDKRKIQPDSTALRSWIDQSAVQIDRLLEMQLTRAQESFFLGQSCVNLLDLAMQARLHAAALHLAEMLDTTWVTPYASQEDGLYQEMLYAIVCNAIEARTRTGLLDRIHKRACTADSYVDPTISFRWQPPAMLTVLAEYQHRIGNEDEADRLFNEVQRIVAEHPEVFEEMPRVKTFCRSWIARHEARKLMAEQRWEEAHQKMEEAIQGAFVAGHCYVSKGLVVERMLRLEAEILDQLGRHDQARGNREHADEIAAHAAMLKRELGPLIEDILHTIEEDIAADKRQRESGQ